MTTPLPHAPLPYAPERLAHCADELIVHVRELSDRGWTPVTSSNFSQRIDDRHVAITVSGRDKGRLTPADIMVVDIDGNPVTTGRQSSAETLLHTQLYRRFPQVGCVLHTHSQTQTVASRLFAGLGYVRLEGYELLKALAGTTTHDTAVDLPVLSNTQNMHSLAAQVDALLDRGCMWGYLIDGHGLYAWGSDLAQARQHLEAFDFLLSCELQLRILRR